MKLKVLDLFSGIGGFSLGLERTGGFETGAFCEIEKYPRLVLKKNWPQVKCYEDVRKLDATKISRDGIGEIDVITAGFPCQDISVAGRGAGVDGKQSGLWLEIIRLCRELRPKYVILENSPSLCTRGGWSILSAFADEFYDAIGLPIPALSIGAKHIRARQYIVAYPSEKRHRSSADEIRARWDSFIYGGGWPTEPRMGRVAYGVPNRVDRVGCLGNAVVPAIATKIGNAILNDIKQDMK